MSRPHVMTETQGLQPDSTVFLYARKCYTESGRQIWRLVWDKPGSTSFCYAEGECSRREFRTAREAIAYGARAYGETAKPLPRSMY